MNWYAALVVIVVLGLISIVFARYEYRNPPAASTTEPLIGTTWYAALQFDFCGKEQASLASNQKTSSSTQAFYTTGDGVITISPKTSSQAGDNAVFGKFVSGYPGLTVNSTNLVVPSGKSSVSYHNGETCAKGTPDAGEKGVVQVAEWPNALLTTAKATTVTGDPKDLKFSANQEITVAFAPVGAKVNRPNGTIVNALLQASETSSTTTTEVPVSTTTTTAPSTTSTTAAPTSTTAAQKSK